MKHGLQSDWLPPVCFDRRISDVGIAGRTKVINKCHQCGATSYKPVMKRDDQGVMGVSGFYRCGGCGLQFKDIDAWRKGDRNPA